VSSQEPDPIEPVPDVAAPVVGPDPDPAILEAIAEPAVVRRAPRYGAFIRAGVLLGAAVGAFAAALAPGAATVPWSAAVGITAFALAGLGALIGAGFAVFADRRSSRR